MRFITDELKPRVERKEMEESNIFVKRHGYKSILEKSLKHSLLVESKERFFPASFLGLPPYCVVDKIRNWHPKKDRVFPEPEFLQDDSPMRSFQKKSQVRVTGRKNFSWFLLRRWSFFLKTQMLWFNERFPVSHRRGPKTCSIDK